MLASTITCESPLDMEISPSPIRSTFHPMKVVEDPISKTSMRTVMEPIKLDSDCSEEEQDSNRKRRLSTRAFTSEQTSKRRLSPEISSRRHFDEPLSTPERISPPPEHSDSLPSPPESETHSPRQPTVSISCSSDNSAGASSNVENYRRQWIQQMEVMPEEEVMKYAKQQNRGIKKPPPTFKKPNIERPLLPKPQTSNPPAQQSQRQYITSSTASTVASTSTLAVPARPQSSDSAVSRTSTPDNSRSQRFEIESRNSSASPPPSVMRAQAVNLQRSPPAQVRLVNGSNANGSVRIYQAPSNSVSRSSVNSHSNSSGINGIGNHSEGNEYVQQSFQPQPQSYQYPTQSRPVGSQTRRSSAATKTSLPTERYCPYLIPLRSRNMDGTIRQDEGNIEVVWVDVREARSALKQLQEANEMTIEPLPLPGSPRFYSSYSQQVQQPQTQAPMHPQQIIIRQPAYSNTPPTNTVPVVSQKYGNYTILQPAQTHHIPVKSSKNEPVVYISPPSRSQGQPSQTQPQRPMFMKSRPNHSSSHRSHSPSGVFRYVGKSGNSVNVESEMMVRSNSSNDGRGEGSIGRRRGKEVSPIVIERSNVPGNSHDE